MVCDGVGGAERGEIASRLAVVSLDTFLRLHPTSNVTATYVQQAVAYAEDQFNAYLTDNEQAAGMATTLTLVCFHETGATVAHIGDSRVYHVRNGQVIWRTDDHSYVAELVKSGVLTPEEAHRHPQRNIITRALQGGSNSIQASVYTTDDLQAGDYFFLCSDGVLERVNDTLIGLVLGGTSESNEQKLARLRQVSTGHTRDNFTAYLIQIEQVTGTSQSTHKGPLSAYSSYHHDRDDNDESITLINVPVPDDFRNTKPLVQPVQSPVVAETPAHPGSVPPPRINALPESTVSRSSGQWSLLLIGLGGAFIGAVGFLGWQWLTDQPENTPAKRNQVSASIIVAEPPSAPPATSGTNSEQRTNATLTNDANTVGMTPPVRPDRQPASGRTSRTTRSDTYEIVRQVDSKLMIVRDTQTKQLGLQNSNGEPLTNRVYTSVGPFENGIASVTVARSPIRFVAKDGHEFTSLSDYRDGVATLRDTDGKAHYLSQGGKWLDEIRAPSNGKIAVCRNKRWGYLNMQGQVSIFLQYDRAESFDEDGTAEVSLNGKTFRIDKKGERVADESATSTEETEKKSRPLSRRNA